MTHQVIWPLGQRAVGVNNEPVAGALAKFYISGTTTPVDTYTDASLNSPHPWPVEADGDGVFPDVYTDGELPLGIDATDPAGVTLPAYPRTGIILLNTTGFGAVGLAFTPTEDAPYTNVQEAIEGIAVAAATQTAPLTRRGTIWTTGGSGDAYTITPSPALTEYETGETFMIKTDRTNTGAATINVNGLGTRNIRRYVGGTATALTAGGLQDGVTYDLAYDGTQFMIVGAGYGPLSGSGANGRWVRHDDGTQICNHLIPDLGPVTTADGALFRSANIGWTYPIAFKTGTVPAITAHIGASMSGGWASLGTAATTASATSFYLRNTVDTFTGTNISLTVAAVGVWK